MADIFISYSSKERYLAAALAAELSQNGYSVWWDHEIVGGADFRREIHRELSAARAVVVIWSEASIESRWVLEEADEALHTSKLIPLRTAGLDVRQVPLGFRTIQTLAHGDSEGLSRALGRMLGAAQADASVAVIDTKISKLQCAAGRRTGATPHVVDAWIIEAGITDAIKAEFFKLDEKLKTTFSAILVDGRAFGVEGSHVALKAAQAVDNPHADLDRLVGYPRGLHNLLEASHSVEKFLKTHPGYAGKSCPILVTEKIGKRLYWMSAGDCALLVYRRGMLTRLNQDHSMGAFLDEMARQGKITTAEAKAAPNRQAQRSGLTRGEIPIIDEPEEPVLLEPGDVVLLATQGLFTLTGDEIAALITANASSPPERTVSALLKAVDAKHRPDQDNVAIICIRVM